MTGPVTGSTRVRLHPLQARHDGDSWVVGRMETGVFISVPAIGHRAITLLSQGGTVGEVAELLRAETGRDIDLPGFVAGLRDHGYVAELDGQALPAPAPPPPTFPWLQPAHVRWLLHPALPWTAGALTLAALVAMVIDTSLLPSYRDLLWSNSGGVVILGNAAIGWALVLLHELAHLATARAAGVPGRINLGTRLQFLTVQTDVTGVWLAPRRTRLTVYLAGIVLNVAVFAALILVVSATDPAEPVRSVLAAAALLSLSGIPLQFLVFMRTDVYFVLQDLTGCANLYADGSAYARFQARRCWHRLLRRGKPPTDPSRQLPAPERRAVRAYTVLLVVGTAACLAVGVAVTVPVVVVLLAGAVGGLAGPPSPAAAFDAAAVLGVTGLVLALWCRAWWRRHGGRVRRAAQRRPRRTATSVSYAEGGDTRGEHRDPHPGQGRDDPVL